MKTSFKTLTLGAALAASLTLANTVTAATFTVDEADHFIWDSGLVPVADFVFDFGTHWGFDLTYGPGNSFESRIIIYDASNTVVGQGSTPLGVNISGSGAYDVVSSQPNFSFTAMYQDADPLTGIANVHVEGRLTSSTSVPDTGSTLALLSVGLAGLPLCRRWQKRA